MICLKNVSKEFNKTKVLSDINLNIDEGQLIRIVGNNGCGKTTLLKILAGILKADDGDITYSEDCNIGAVIENPSFIENESLLYNLKNNITFVCNLNQTIDGQQVGYQWQENKGSGWQNIFGATGASYPVNRVGKAGYQ